MLLSAQPQGPLQPDPAGMAPVRHSLRQHEGGLRFWVEDTCWERRPHSARGSRRAYLRREPVDGQQRVLQQRRRLPHPRAAGASGYPDRVRKVSRDGAM